MGNQSGWGWGGGVWDLVAGGGGERWVGEVGRGVEVEGEGGWLSALSGISLANHTATVGPGCHLFKGNHKTVLTPFPPPPSLSLSLSLFCLALSRFESG